MRLRKVKNFPVRKKISEVNSGFNNKYLINNDISIWFLWQKSSCFCMKDLDLSIFRIKKVIKI